MTWDFYVDDLQGNHKCNMILGRDIFYKLQIYKCFSDNIIRAKQTSEKEKLCNISKIINSTKNRKYTHCRLILRKEMNCRVCKSKFNSLIIILDSRSSSSILLVKIYTNYEKSDQDGQMENTRR